MLLKAAPPALGGGCASGAGQGHCVSSRLACGQMLLTAAPPALGGGCVTIAGLWHCVSARLACGQMFLKAAPPALGAGLLQVRASGTAFRHGWPAAKCSSQQRPGPWGGCASGADHGHCVSSRLAFGQMFLTAAPRPLGRVCFRCGPRALRFVTVGLRPNAPQRSTPGPWGRVCFGCGPRALRFVTVGLRPNVPHSSAPRPVARGSVSKFSTKNTPNVENTRKE